MHKCADPNDLKTCENLINRIRPDNNLSADFKYQFEIFYLELKEFFNVQGLDKLLDSALHGQNAELLDREIIMKFIDQKRNPAEG